VSLVNAFQEMGRPTWLTRRRLLINAGLSAAGAAIVGRHEAFVANAEASAQERGLAPGKRPVAGPTPIELTCVDADVRTYSGTFQSHNQKVVQNARGIFMTHVRTRNAAYTAQEWRLSRSRDGGHSFTTIFSATNATNPPVLESDAEGNISLGRPDFINTNAYLYRFLAKEDYRSPHISRIEGGSAGKYAMMLDEPRRQLYWFAHNRTFARLDLEGGVLTCTKLFSHPSPAGLEYPQMSLDAHGVLHAAWTTVMVPSPVPGERFVYWDIHYMQSPDGGLTWRTMAGAPISIPVPADNSGPTDRITLDDEFEVSTWLANLLVKEGKAHFLYMAQTEPRRQHYVRCDLGSHRRELDLQPQFAGQGLSLSGQDGFFVSRRNVSNSTLYCVAHDAGAPRLGCLASNDNGSTWYDYAIGDKVTQLYAVGGCREITPDGWVIGSFTDRLSPKSAGSEVTDTARVYFFRIRAGVKRQSRA